MTRSGDALALLGTIFHWNGEFCGYIGFSSICVWGGTDVAAIVVFGNRKEEHSLIYM